MFLEVKTTAQELIFKSISMSVSKRGITQIATNSFLFLLWLMSNNNLLFSFNFVNPRTKYTLKSFA